MYCSTSSRWDLLSAKKGANRKATIKTLLGSCWFQSKQHAQPSPLRSQLSETLTLCFSGQHHENAHENVNYESVSHAGLSAHTKQRVSCDALPILGSPAHHILRDVDLPCGVGVVLGTGGELANIQKIAQQASGFGSK